MDHKCSTKGAGIEVSSGREDHQLPHTRAFAKNKAYRFGSLRNRQLSWRESLIVRSRTKDVTKLKKVSVTDIVPKEMLPFTFGGLHEVETVLLKHPEASLRQYLTCTKHPTHAGFTKVKDFSTSLLPADYRSDLIFDWIRCLAELTVHISVSAVSECRPRLCDGTTCPYPFYVPGGGQCPRVGSGFIWKVEPCQPPSDRQQTSPCSIPGNCHTKVYLMTALHLIYDHRELADLKILLNHDGDSQKAEPLLGQFSVEYSDKPGDKCQLICCVHDQNLGQKLRAAYKRRCDMYKKVRDVYGEADPPRNTPVVVVSHPHGCEKQISVGKAVRWEKRAGGEFYYSALTYDSCTCPGSSGGTVTALGSMVGCFGVYHHSEALMDGSNRSGGDWYWQS